MTWALHDSNVDRLTVVQLRRGVQLLVVGAGGWCRAGATHKFRVRLYRFNLTAISSTGVHINP